MWIRHPAWVLGGLGGLAVAIVAVVGWILFAPSATTDSASNLVAGSSELELDTGSADDSAPVDATSQPLPLPSGSAPTDGSAAEDPATGASSAEAPMSEMDHSQEPDSASSADAAQVAQLLETLRNDQAKFSRFADVPSAQLDLSALTEAASRPDNGTVGDGQFRAACEYSHLGYDDPIVLPGQPGRSHLHLFFGNTSVDSFTTADSLLNTGGGTCNGFELNRSGYWTPALLDDKGNVVVPDAIILYYKTKQPDRVQPMPQGLQMLAGNTQDNTFEASHQLNWSCGGSGAAYNLTNQIPECGGDIINATIRFPNCWDGVNLQSKDHLSHMTLVAEEESCPASHPVRLPQISILLYYPGADSVAGWHLSSDHHGGRSTGPGESLHADWWGGWNDQAVRLWSDGCMTAARNCSFGQTGTDRQLAALNPLQVYEGSNYLPLPAGAGPEHQGMGG